jgi:hypothetical protein
VHLVSQVLRNDRLVLTSVSGALVHRHSELGLVVQKVVKVALVACPTSRSLLLALQIVCLAVGEGEPKGAGLAVLVVLELC